LTESPGSRKTTAAVFPAMWTRETNGSSKERSGAGATIDL